MARPRPGLGHDAASEDPLTPAEVDVFEVREVIVVESTRGQKLGALDGHQSAAREEPLLPGDPFGHRGDRTPDLALKRVAVERQETVGEVVPLAGRIGEPSGDCHHVSIGAIQGLDQPLERLRLDHCIVVDEDEVPAAGGFGAQTTPRRKAHVCAGGNAARRRVPPQELVDRELRGVVHHQDFRREAAVAGLLERCERLEEPFAVAMVHDDDRCVRRLHDDDAVRRRNRLQKRGAEDSGSGSLPPFTRAPRHQERSGRATRPHVLS